MEDVARALRLERERGFSIDGLRDNATFIDAILTATQAAAKTSQHEKRNALRKAVINAALPQAGTTAVQQQFIGMIDRFTEWHLVLETDQP